jgi:hypothetical protein
MNEFMNTTTI